MAFSPNVSGANIRQTATAMANEVERYMARWKFYADKLNTLSAAELASYGLDENYQNYLGSLRVSLLNIELKYRNQAPLDSSDPSYFVKQFSDLTVF